MINTEPSGALSVSFLFQPAKTCSYGSDTWSVIVMKELMLKMFVNRVLRKVFGPKREEITGDWTELCNMGHNKLHLSPHITRQSN